MNDDFQKIHKLLEHWKTHNSEHAENYRVWAKKMEILGKQELASLLFEAYKQSLKLNEVFEKALKVTE